MLKNFLGIQDEDSYKAQSNIDLLKALTGFRRKHLCVKECLNL
jgi:hypothetical protein